MEPMLDLIPPEIIERVADFLPLESRLALRSTSVRLRDVMNGSFARYTVRVRVPIRPDAEVSWFKGSLELAGSITDEAIRVLLSAFEDPKITGIYDHVPSDINNSESIKSSTLQSLMTDNLLRVDLRRTMLHFADFVRLAECANIQAVSLVGCNVDDVAFALLGKCNGLKEIRLVSCTRITGNAMILLSNFESLVSLELVACHGSITDEMVRKLTGPPTLRHLNLRGNTEITDAAVESLSVLTGLRSLDLSACRRVTGTGVELLSKSCLLLRKVRFDVNTRMTADVTKHLAALPELESVSLQHNDVWVTDKAVRRLSKSASLEEVDLSHCAQLTHLAAVHLSECATLLTVVLDRCPLMDARAASALARSASLVFVGLRHCPLIGDDAAKKLMASTSIRIIDLDNCPSITDATVYAFLVSKSVVSVSLNGCPLVTDEARRTMALGK